MRIYLTQCHWSQSEWLSIVIRNVTTIVTDKSFTTTFLMPTVMKVLAMATTPVDDQIGAEELAARCNHWLERLIVPVTVGGIDPNLPMQTNAYKKILISAEWAVAAEDSMEERRSLSECSDTTSDMHIYLGTIKMIHEIFQFLTADVLGLEQELQKRSLPPISPDQSSTSDTCMPSCKRARVSGGSRCYEAAPAGVGPKWLDNGSLIQGDIGCHFEELLLGGLRVHADHSHWDIKDLYFEQARVVAIGADGSRTVVSDATAAPGVKPRGISTACYSFEFACFEPQFAYTSFFSDFVAELELPHEEEPLTMEEVLSKALVDRDRLQPQPHKSKAIRIKASHYGRRNNADGAQSIDIDKYDNESPERSSAENLGDVRPSPYSPSPPRVRKD
jgi:hypothetical protein